MTSWYAVKMKHQISQKNRARFPKPNSPIIFASICN